MAFAFFVKNLGNLSEWGSKHFFLIMSGIMFCIDLTSPSEYEEYSLGFLLRNFHRILNNAEVLQGMSRFRNQKYEDILHASRYSDEQLHEMTT